MHARGSLTEREHPDIGTISQYQTPLRYKDIQPPELNDVHGLSEDTDAVLKEFLALSDQDLQNLRDREVIV